MKTTNEPQADAPPTPTATTPPTPPTAMPVEAVRGVEPYRASEAPAGARLLLDKNEGPAASAAAVRAMRSLPAETPRRYAAAFALEELLAERFGVSPACALATNGGDDAIDRLCRAYVEPGRGFVLHRPTFEIIERGAELARGRVKAVGWASGAFPRDELLGQIDDDTAMVAVVSPNNPTGLVAPTEELLTIADAARGVGALALFDLAYVEFADGDPTLELLANPNAAVVRTLSKAWGLAGARVGYLLAGEEVIKAARCTGGPYAVAAPSLRIAEAALGGGEEVTRGFVENVRNERRLLRELIEELGGGARESQANFVLARFADARGVRERLLERGVAVRAFEGAPGLGDALRIACPGSPREFGALCAALAAAVGKGVDISERTYEGAKAMAGSRCGEAKRETLETKISCSVELDGTGQAEITTGLGFLDHMLTALAKHARIDIELDCDGDLEVDDHHSVEDCAIALGSAISEALGERRGIRRFGHAYAPLDEALSRVVIDLSGRPAWVTNLGLTRESLGGVACENIAHFFSTLAVSLKAAIHVDVLRGENDHHRAEAAFKALALALRQAVSIDDFDDTPSTKGSL